MTLAGAECCRQAMRIKHLQSDPRGRADVRIRRIGQAAEHDHTHLVLMLAGAGEVISQADRLAIAQDDGMTIGPNEWHAFRAGPGLDLEFVV